MLLLKYLVKLVKVLNSETSAAALGLALSLGMFLGLVPLLTLQGLLALAAVLFLRVNLASAFLTLAVFKLAGLALRGAFDALGTSLLENTSLTGLWTFFYNAPVLSFMGTNHTVTLGATITALLLLAPVFLVSRALILAYRGRFSEWWTRLTIVNAFRGTKVYRLYLWLDSPFHS